MLEHLEPRTVFHYFEDITKIPHGSGNIQAISDYIAGFAKEHNLKYVQDEIGDVIIWKEASPGYENEEPVMIQGHMDMVAVKDNDCNIDLEKDGLDVRIDGDYVYAKGTSLGGDDGIAVAYALALLADDSIMHPALEVVLTVNEETGMDGAIYIDLSECKAKQLINLDSELEGEFIVSCAGGARITGEVRFEREDFVVDSEAVYELLIHQLTGGHSGAEIHHNRVNGNVLLGSVLEKLSGEFSLSLYNMEGGTKDNAIAVYAKATVSVPGEAAKAFEERVAKLNTEMKAEYLSTDPDMIICVNPVSNNTLPAMKASTLKQMTAILTKCPNGVCAMCEDMPELVETSLNLGILRTCENKVTLDYSLRSSVAARKEELVLKVGAVLEENGASWKRGGEYPAWEYRKDSPLRDRMVAVYEDMYQKKPSVVALHAGLECGILSQKMEGLDCISIGPDMKDIHTTKEKLSISSTKRVWEYLLEVLRVRKNIVLIGMPGVGKSTVGVVLAKSIGYQFVDSDLVIQEQAGKRLHDIIAEKGNDGFLQYENEINTGIYVDKCVIATGGSAVYGEEAMKHLGRIGTIIYLKLPCEEIEERVGDLTQRGVALKKGQGLKELYEERTPLYEKYANYTIDCMDKSIREIVAEIQKNTFFSQLQQNSITISN